MPLLRAGWRGRVGRWTVGVGVFALAVWLIPAWWCAREAPGWYRGEAAAQQRLAAGVRQWVESELGAQAYHTGSTRFDGEWRFGTYMMAGMGLGQTALEHPEWRAEHVRVMGRCIDRLLGEPVTGFDKDAWKRTALEDLDRDEAGHAAYLGYLNLVLSFERLLDPKARHAELSDRVTAALVRRFERSPTLLIETYPGETYPVDNAAGIGSIGLYDRATGADHGALLRRWVSACRERYVDARTGLLIQGVDSRSGTARDAPRGSGTALAAYFLGYADRELSRDLHAAVKRELAGSILGFGVVREYPRGEAGNGDIDSGPVILGYGVSATGFALAGARMHGDPELYGRLYAMAYLFGAPWDGGGARHHVTGGPLGDALLLAMLTAPRGEVGR